MEKITSELAEKAVKWFESEEVKALLTATEKAADTDTGTFEVVITTENLDRYEEVIKMDGWDLTHYTKNPVVLWGHDHFTLPIGMATSVSIEDGKMVARGKFAPHEHAQQIRALYDAGIVRATSVGFIAREREGNLITKAELLEFSFVSVPANPYALSLDTLSVEEVSGLVSRGILNLKDIKDSEKDTEEEEKDTETDTPGEETTPQETPEADEPETPENEPKEEDQPIDEPVLSDEDIEKIAQLVGKQVVAAIKDGALEAEEPERTEDEGEDEEAEEAKGEKLHEIKRTMQSLDTTLGDVLAEMRQAHHS